MEKQVKFSMEEINQIVGYYVFDNNLLDNVKRVDVIFHQGKEPDDSYIIVKENTTTT